jgi:hypothetical protein
MVLDQLSLLKMSPGGAAASFGIVLSQGPLPDLEASARPAPPCTILPYCWSGLTRDGTDQGAPAAPLYPAIAPVQQQFSILLPIPGEIRPS